VPSVAQFLLVSRVLDYIGVISQAQVTAVAAAGENGIHNMSLTVYNLLSNGFTLEFIIVNKIKKGAYKQVVRSKVEMAGIDLYSSWFSPGS
jgi:hypothetical protein